MRYNRKSVAVITAPATNAVSLADMKTYLLEDGSEFDDLITDFIVAAQDMVKQYIRRSIITETLELTMDGFSEGADDDERLLSLGSGVHVGSYPYILGRPNEVDLPFAPIQSVTSIKTFDRDNTESTFSSDNYELDETGGRIYLDEGVTWPDNLRGREAVKIRYISGYGDAADVPAPIINAIKTHVGQMYDCRQMCGLGDACKGMLSGYKLYDGLGY